MNLDPVLVDLVWDSFLIEDMRTRDTDGLWTVLMSSVEPED
jgi:hypothetical protein